MHETFYEPTDQDLRDYAQHCTTPFKAGEYHIPEIPYGIIDAMNRRAAAVGSPLYAQQTAYANYNGHRIGVHYNDYRGYYITEYYWGERVVLARGSFQDCLAAAIKEHKRGALGCCVAISPREDDREADEICKLTPELVSGSLNDSPPREWWTWKHAAASRSVRDCANPNALRMNFDYDLLQSAQTEEEYERLLTEKFGRAWTF